MPPGATEPSGIVPKVGTHVSNLRIISPAARPTPSAPTPVEEAALTTITTGTEPTARASKSLVDGHRIRWCHSCNRRLPDNGDSPFCKTGTARHPACHPRYKNAYQNINRDLQRPDISVARDLLREVHRLTDRLASTRTAYIEYLAGQADDETKKFIRETGALIARIRNDLPDPPKRRLDK